MATIGEYGKVQKQGSDKVNRPVDIVELHSCLKTLTQLPRQRILRILTDVLFHNCLKEPGKCIHRGISEREQQVLVLVANGYSRQDISLTLGISPNTAARHISNIYGKLDISSVAEATTFAIATGMVSIDDRWH